MKNNQTLKELLNERHLTYLHQITEVMLDGKNYGLNQIEANIGIVKAAEIKRKIAFIAKLQYNISNITMGKFLQLDNSHIGYYLRTALYKYHISKHYRSTIDAFIDKLK